MPTGETVISQGLGKPNMDTQSDNPPHTPRRRANLWVEVYLHLFGTNEDRSQSDDTHHDQAIAADGGTKDASQ